MRLRWEEVVALIRRLILLCERMTSCRVRSSDVLLGHGRGILARRPVAAACDAFGGWCFVDGEGLAVRVSWRLAVESQTGQYRLARHDARNVKTQDLIPNTR